jgi:hypothetical protein
MSLPYPTDPSLPSNPAPLFSDSTAARGDHLRANNAEIWANFTDINDHASRYDYVIDSQDKFDALVASGTWLNAKNVLFTTNVTRAAQTTIPATVEKIHAINGATLTVTDLTTGQYGFGYATVPTDTKFEIRNFAVNATGTGSIYGFNSCNKLTNCTGTGTGTGYGYGFNSCNKLTNCTATGTGDNGYGFYDCNQLTNCTGTGTGTGTDGSGIGFYDCNQLTNCTGTGTGTDTDGYGYGFDSCNQLTNCTGTGTGDNGYGFNDCNQVTNCTATGTGTDGNGYGFQSCTQVTNCTATGTGTGTGAAGYGFYSCIQVTNCTGTGTGTGNGYGYRGCRKCMCNKAGGASTTSTYNTSYADAGTSNACADTAAGGYNS